jgi:hypothetical protein
MQGRRGKGCCTAYAVDVEPNGGLLVHCLQRKQAAHNLRGQLRQEADSGGKQNTGVRETACAYASR